MNASLIASTFVFLWLALNMNDASAKKDCDLLLTKRSYLAHMMCLAEKRDPIQYMNEVFPIFSSETTFNQKNYLSRKKSLNI